MVQNRSLLVVASVSAVLLSGCSFVEDAVWPSLTGEAPSADARDAAAPTTVAIAPSANERAASPTIMPGAPPQLGNTNFQVQPPQPGSPTGTFVGNKVVQLRADLARLQGSIRVHNGELQTVRQQTIANAQAYHSRVAGIRSRLQVGTTPGNPELVVEWNQSQTQLETVNADIGRMNALSNKVASDAALAAYLLESTRASFGLSGAIDEDHRQLAVLEDDVNRTVVLIDRLLTELSDDIRRQSRYVASERGDLNTLALAIKNGEFFGQSLQTRAVQSAAAGLPGAGARPSLSGAIQGRRPLVVIRFDRPNVEYQQALYSAVSRALQRRPDATFDLVAVTPANASAARTALDTNAARRNAQTVLRALADMGLPPSRVALSATTAQDARTNEVRLFIR